MSSNALPTALASHYVIEVVNAQVKLSEAIQTLQDLQRKLAQKGEDHGLGAVIGKLMVLSDNNDETVRGAGLNSVLRSIMDRKDQSTQ